MPPINSKKTWKEMNNERKVKRKKWKEEKLMKQIVLDKGHEETIDQVVEKEEKSDNDLLQSETNLNQVKDSKLLKALRTISIAVPGSILDNAQSQELRTYLGGQIARAACIYNVDEIIVFDDKGDGNDDKMAIIGSNKGTVRACVQLARILQYLECPQYLRKFIFPVHNDLQYAGLLNPLDAPHHLRQQDQFEFREGVVSDVPLKFGRGSYVNVGLLKDVVVDKVLAPKLRVTVKITPPAEGMKRLYGVVVPPSQPKSELNVYWGYTVRLAGCLSDVLADGPYEGGYDLTIGTSEKGENVDDLSQSFTSDYKHCLVVFGGLDGLESAVECDEKLSTTADEMNLLFDKYINTCPKQGSRVIRTEEAILISLAKLSTVLNL